MKKHNLYLAADLKVIMLKDMLLEYGKQYYGFLRHDEPKDGIGGLDDHFTFEEIPEQPNGKRNPKVFCGEFITVTRRDDGTHRINLKLLKTGTLNNIDGYALGVCNEIRKALKGLVEK